MECYCFKLIVDQFVKRDFTYWQDISLFFFYVMPDVPCRYLSDNSMYDVQLM